MYRLQYVPRAAGSLATDRFPNRSINTHPPTKPDNAARGSVPMAVTSLDNGERAKSRAADRMPQPQTYQFHEYRLDRSARELSRHGEPVAVPTRVFDCLVYLIENRERAIGRD